MKGPPNNFWGKLELDTDDIVVGWHPLADHCADVAATCELLLQRTLLRPRLARLGGLSDLTTRQVARLAAIAALHDVGKYNLGFQNKALRPRSASVAGHVAEAVDLLDEGAGKARERFLAAIPTADLLAWGEREVGARLLVAAIGHHGRPVKVGSGHQAAPWQPDRGLDPFLGIAALADRTRDWFPEAFAGTGNDLLPTPAAFQHGFSGLVMLADWLGSDTRFFPYSLPGDGDRMPFARGAALRAIREVGLDVIEGRAALGAERPGFERLSPHPPRDVQRRILEAGIDPSGDLTILEAETGSGKTEAALARFLVLFHAGLVDGMVFALPTRTAATQMHRRIVEATARAFPDESTRPPVVLAVPGYLRVDATEGRRLPGFDVLWNDDDRARTRHRGWAAENPKRYLAGAIVVGTIDQVLLSTLQVGHAHLRATALLRQLLVVDEVHASDAYMTRLLETVLAHHLAAGGHALLMSATLGSAATTRLLGAAGSRPAQPDLAAASQMPYPLVTSRAGSGEIRRSTAEGPAEDKPVRVEIRPAMDAPDAIAEEAVAAAQGGAKVVVLRNTVAGCLATQAAVEALAGAQGASSLLFRCEGRAAPHHARYAKEDREALDVALEAAIGKVRPAGGLVVVATQTIQQSLDLDADLLLTDLAPIDVVLQRVGRLHRHPGRARAPGFEGPRVVVLCPADRDLAALLRPSGTARGKHGIGTVYEDLRILEATWRVLESAQEIAIPSMNRRLVEAATHPAALDAITSMLGAGFVRHAEVMTGTRLAEGRLADLNVMDRSVPFWDASFPSKELQGRAQTRLGEGDRVAELPRRVPSPFGKLITRFTIPAWLCRGAGPDAAVETLDAGPTRLTFTFGDRRYIYDRLGLRPSDAAPQEDLADV